MTLTYEVLEGAVAGTAAGFRSVTRLEPLGGPGDKLFPPTFGETVRVPVPIGEDREERRRTKYAVEWRRIEGQSRLCVLLDSVASQANRMETALLEGYQDKELSFPFVRVDFSSEVNDDPEFDLSCLGGDGYISTLQAPHRLADALLRDSLLDGVPFRESVPGRRFSQASPSNAGALLDLCPASLLFGIWDSTGLKSGPGSKYQRAIVSEIVGVGVEFGLRTASRIDPAEIEKTEIYETPDGDWTIDPSEAKQEKEKPVLYKRGGEKAGTPAVINHGNVKPSSEPEAGGVTVDYAEQVTVLSLPALRRLRFPQRSDGTAIDREARSAVEITARTALAALGLAAIAYQRTNGFDLRSRCAMRALGPLSLELVRAEEPEGGPEVYSLDRDAAKELLDRAAQALKKVDMPWRTEPVDLKPAAKLVALIRKSRALSIPHSEDK